jgi:hypothetical protein
MHIYNLIVILLALLSGCSANYQQCQVLVDLQEPVSTNYFPVVIPFPQSNTSSIANFSQYVEIHTEWGGSIDALGKVTK